MDRKFLAVSIFILFGLGTPVSGAWHAENVTDTIHWPLPSLALTSSDYPRINFIQSEKVMLASNDGGGWIFETIDGTMDWPGYHSFALTAGDRPQVCYEDHVTRELNYSRKTLLGSWTSETVDSYCGENSLAIDSNNMPHISYDGNYCLKYAWKNETGWHKETVDGTEGGPTQVGMYNSIALTSKGMPVISYVGGDLRVLKIAWKDKYGWHIKKIPKTSHAWDTSLALDSRDRPCIAYQDYEKEDLKYAWKNAAGWHVVTVDGEGKVGLSPSLALDARNRPHISYRDSDPDSLKHAWKTSSGWHREIVDLNNNLGDGTSLALDSGGHPHIAYKTSTAVLRYAWRD
jgi:hypothetical protein